MMKSVEELKLQANDCTQKGEHKHAEEIYDQMIAITLKKCSQLCPSEIADAYNNRGLARYRQVAFAEAIDDFTQAIIYNRKLTAAFYNRGLIHYRLARFSTAIEDMDQALSLEPTFKSAELCKQQSLEDLKTS